MTNELTILCGIPGSGKSTWASRQTGHVITLDWFRYNESKPEPGFWRAIASHVRAKLETTPVIVDGCNLLPNHRARWLSVAYELDAPTRLVIVNRKLERCIEAQQKRSHPVPIAQVIEYHRRYRRFLARELQREPWDTVERINVK